MSKSLRRLCVGGLFAALGVCGTAQAEVIAVHGQGFLSRTPSGLRVIHTKGTAYEMGYQYGALLGDDIRRVNTTLNRMAEMEFQIPGPVTDVVKALGGTIFKPYFRENELAHLRGMLDAMDTYHKGHNVSIETLILLNSIVDAGGIVGNMDRNCNSFAAWGSLTKDGKLLQTRNIDLFVGYGLEDFPVMEVAKEYGKVPIANPSWTGHMAMASGLNAHGVGVGQIWAKSVDEGFGRPWVLNVRESLQQTDSCIDVANHLRDEPTRTYGTNFIFADPNNGFGVAVETTQNHFAMFHNMDPLERELTYNGEAAALQIPDAVFRADNSFDPTIRSLQIASNGPDGDPREAGAYKNRYQGQCERLVAYRDRGVKITEKEAIDISRETAMPSASLQCNVYNNTDLQMWVAYSKFDEKGNAIPAFRNEYQHFNFDAVAPVMNLQLNSDRFKFNSEMVLSVDVQNFGTPKDMNLYVVLEAAGNYYYLPNFTEAPEAIPVKLQKKADVSMELLKVKFPKEFPRGDYAFYAALVDAKSGDLADLSIRPWSFARY